MGEMIDWDRARWENQAACLLNKHRGIACPGA
jgi:hypothetical protein